MGSDSEGFEDNELGEHGGYSDVFQKGENGRFCHTFCYIVSLLNVLVITSNDCKVELLIICTTTLISIHECHHKVWDNKAHSVIDKTYFAIIASNVSEWEIVTFLLV